MLDDNLLHELRSRFYYVRTDIRGRERLFFDNAGGSLRLKAAEEAFHEYDAMPDASEHSNDLALYLAEVEEKGRKDIMEVLFGASSGTFVPGLTASLLMEELAGIVGDAASGTSYVTTMLEHPSSFDAMTENAEKHGCELRVAPVDPETGGVEAEAVLSLVDEKTAVLSCMAASNITGFVYDLETICREARKINPNIYILVDAVQHAPHAPLDPEGLGADVMTMAPYKCFGVRGWGLAWLSDRVKDLRHHKLLGQKSDYWELGSPATGHFAALSAVADYIAELGREAEGFGRTRREHFVRGMERIAAHERGLLDVLLEGTERRRGLRHIEGVRVQMDGRDLTRRDLILALEFDRLSCRAASAAYEKHGVITFERSGDSIFSARMVGAFGSPGIVRVSPLHLNREREMERFLSITEQICKEASCRPRIR